MFKYFLDTGKKQSFTSDVTGSGAQRATKDYLLRIYTKVDLAKRRGVSNLKRVTRNECSDIVTTK